MEDVAEDTRANWRLWCECMTNASPVHKFLGMRRRHLVPLKREKTPCIFISLLGLEGTDLYAILCISNCILWMNTIICLNKWQWGPICFTYSHSPAVVIPNTYRDQKTPQYVSQLEHKKMVFMPTSDFNFDFWSDMDETIAGKSIFDLWSTVLENCMCTNFRKPIIPAVKKHPGVNCKEPSGFWRGWIVLQLVSPTWVFAQGNS